MEDDLTEQALEFLLENDTLQKKVIEPIKRKVFPYVLCIAFFNIMLFILVVYVARRLSVIL
jgi:hypothetical protein